MAALLTPQLALASWSEQCVFSGKVISDPTHEEAVGMERGHVLKFSFQPSSALTLENSYVPCDKYVGEGIMVRVSGLAGSETIRSGDYLVLQYRYEDFDCGRPPEPCRSRSFKILRQGGWPDDA